MKLTITPGPWVPKPANDGCGDIGIVADGYVIAEVFCDIRAPHEAARGEALANATRITLAPRMEQALRDLREALRSGPPELVGFSSLKADAFRAGWQQAFDHIFELTGESRRLLDEIDEICDDQEEKAA